MRPHLEGVAGPSAVGRVSHRRLQCDTVLQRLQQTRPRLCSHESLRVHSDAALVRFPNFKCLNAFSGFPG